MVYPLCISIFYFFLFLNNIPPYGYTVFYLSVDGHLDCFHSLAIVDNVPLNIHVHMLTQKPIHSCFCVSIFYFSLVNT